MIKRENIKDYKIIRLIIMEMCQHPARNVNTYVFLFYVQFKTNILKMRIVKGTSAM